MRRRRRLLTFFSAVSLLLCMAACVMWARSYRSLEPDYCGIFVSQTATRYSLEFVGGRITLLAPPAPISPSKGPLPRPAAYPDWPASDNPVTRSKLMTLPPQATAPAVVAELRNDQIVWDVCRDTMRFYAPVNGEARSFFSPRGAPGTAAQVLTPFDPLTASEKAGLKNPARHRPFPRDGAVTPALLAALEDPDRWVAAHVVLTRLHGEFPVGGAVGHAFDHALEAPWVNTFNGLRAELHPSGERYSWSSEPGEDRCEVTPCSATVNPAQRVMIRDRWHRRLDRPLLSIAWWRVVLGTLLLPAILLTGTAGRHALRKLRTRRALCPACGYDLRPTTGQCPECGAAPTAQ